MQGSNLRFLNLLHRQVDFLPLSHLARPDTVQCYVYSTTMVGFIFLDSKITADSDCSHEIKRGLLHGKEAVKNLDNILKSRDITLLTKFHTIKSLVFPVVMYRCESCTIKKIEYQIIDAFLLWCSRRLLRVP